VSFLETVRRARSHLEEQGRVSLRALKREFELDDDALDELVEELVDVQQVAVREERVLVWAGPARSEPPITELSRVERAPRDYTPRHLADKILQSKSALEGERKQVTVLFADVKGSMELAEQVDPEEWHRILDRFFQILSEGVHRFEGTINQYTGDGIMALFGAPIAHEDHAQRACYAALHLQDALRVYANELRVDRGLSFAVRIGLNSGEVVVGKIGDDLRMDYTAQGHTVGLAQRMEQLAEPGRTYVTAETEALVRGYFELEDLGPSKVGVGSAPVSIFALVGTGSVRTRLDRSRSRGFSKFVGREEERGVLEAALEQALQGHGRVVGLVAEAGIGKSRLCAEFLDRCRQRGIAVQQASGFAHAKNIPLLPILQLLRNAFGVEERDSDQTARDKIAGRVVLGDESLTHALPFLFEIMGVPDPERPGEELEPEARERLLVEIVKRLTRARSERHPAVWLIEDLHWLDGASDAIVGLLVEAVPDTRSLLILNFRPEYQARWGQMSFYQQLPLLPLGPEDVGDLLEDLLGADPALAELSRRIQERTAGNPFFVEEVVHTLEEEGFLEGSKGAYRLARPVEELRIPAVVQSVLAARIDRLPEREKQVLQAASVVGSSFSRSLLARINPLPELELDDSLRALVSAELIYEEFLYPEPEYAFRHPLTREVAYGSQLGDRRARVHAAAAEALEDSDPAKLEERAALLAHHWEAAGKMLKAARWHRRAAIWAGRAQMREANRHWVHVCELLDDVPEDAETLALGVEARGALLSLQGYEAPADADRLMAEARELAERSGDPRVKASMLGTTGIVQMLRGSTADAVTSLREALRLAGETGDQSVGRLYPYLSVVLAEGQGPRESMEIVSRIEPVMRARPELGKAGMGLTSVIALGLTYRGLWLAWAGRIDEGRAEIQRGLELARTQGDAPTLFSAEGNAIFLEVEAGNAKAALALTSRQGKMETGIGTITLAPAWAHACAERWAEAEASFAEVWGRLVHAVRRSSLPVRALCWHALGDGERAAKTLRETLVEARGAGASMTELRASLSLARILAQTDARAYQREIEELLARAQGLIEATGAALFGAQLHAERAELMRGLGDADAQRRECDEARRLYAAMGAAGHAERLTRQLDS
jgi:class 3 adenylate cyclase